MQINTADKNKEKGKLEKKLEKMRKKRTPETKNHMNA